MIQRIQTLFLLLGAISAGFISMNLLGIWEHFAFAIAALVSLIIIFLYKKRKLQIKAKHIFFIFLDQNQFLPFLENYKKY